MQQGERVCAARSKAPARWLGEALQRKARAPFARPVLSGVTAVVGAFLQTLGLLLRCCPLVSPFSFLFRRVRVPTRIFATNVPRRTSPDFDTKEMNEKELKELCALPNIIVP